MKSKLSRRSLLKGVVITGIASSSNTSLAGDKNPYQEKTFEALVETIVPGKANDPLGDPGSSEAESIKYLWKVERSKLLPIPFGLIRGVISTLLNFKSYIRYRKKFASLNQRQREIVAANIEQIPGMQLFYRVIRAPFYTGAINNVGFDYFGYPGPNEGYKNFSFKQELAPSHPRTTNGNLP